MTTIERPQLDDRTDPTRDIVAEVEGDTTAMAIEPTFGRVRPQPDAGPGASTAAADTVTAPPAFGDSAEDPCTFRINGDKGTRYLLGNRTPYVIQLRHPREPALELIVPPLAERVVAGSRLKPFEEQLPPYRGRHELRVRPYVNPQPQTQVISRLIGLAVLVLFAVIAFDLLTKGSLHQPEFYGTAAGAAIIVAVCLATAYILDGERREEEGRADEVEGDIAFGVGGSYASGNETFRRASHLLTLVIVIAVGAVLPAAAIVIGTDTAAFLSFDGGFHVLDGNQSQLVGRGIQIVYTAVLSLFPALLFFQFDRHCVGTIRNQWIRSIFQMDRRMRTMADVNACYGNVLSEASNNSTDSVRFLGGRNSPIIVTTILIALGWTVLVLQTRSFDFTDNDSTVIFEVLSPTPTAAAMAFLGAYFFGVYLVLRSYFRGDLRPKLYNQITARLVTVVVVAYLINTIFVDDTEDPSFLLTMAFLAGIVPTTVVRRMTMIAGSVVKSPALAWVVPSAMEDAFSPSRPLTQVDGIDLYDASRLETEGIPDVPALATSDLVQLMVDTRLPIARLVDWSDQAALMVVLSSDDDDDHLDPRIRALRSRGIRTATDFLATCEDPSDQTLATVEACLASSKPAADTEGDASTLPVVPPITAEDVCEAVQRLAVMPQVQQWYASDIARVDRAWIELPEVSWSSV